jgi:hypothetical protein
MRGIRKIFTAAGVILLVLILFLGIVIWQHEFIIRELLSYRISQVINNQPNSLYQYSFERLNINVWKGNFELDNFTIQPRLQKLDSLKITGGANKTIIHGRIDRFLVSNLRVFKFIRSGKLQIDSIQLKNAEVILYADQESKSQKDTASSIVIDIFNTGLKEVRVLNMSLNNFRFSLNKVSPDTMHTLTLERVDIEVKEFYTDPSILTREKGYDIAWLNFSVKGLQTMAVNNYQIKTGAIYFDSGKNLLGIDTLSMVPSAGKMKTDDYFFLETRGIRIYNLDYKELIRRGRIKLGKLLIIEPFFKFNKPPPKMKKDKLRLLPAATFRKIPFPLSVDTILVRNGRFVFFKEGFKEPKINLTATRLNLDAFHFTTYPKGPGRNAVFNVSGTTRFMDEAPLKIKFAFPLERPCDPFTSEGHMGGLDARTLNRIIKNTIGVKIISGKIHSMDFDFSANDTLSRGKLRLAYTGMKIKVLKLDKDDFTQSEEKNFLSFTANLAVNTNNDPAKSSFHEGTIYRVRNPRKTFLDYSLESVITGVLTSLVPRSKSVMINKQNKTK